MLHGRDAEQARIDDLLAGARAGRSGVLVVRGEAGIGKSALLDYAAAQGVPTVRGAGIESEAELPFAALHLLIRPAMELVRRLPPRQRDALEGAFGLGEGAPDRMLIGLAVLTLLAEEAARGPLLCVIDDAHWLDRASAEALLFAARRLDAEGVVIVFATRSGPQDFPAPGLPELALGGLRPEAAAALLDAGATRLSPATRYRVLSEAGGNPLALRELPSVVGEDEVGGANPLPMTQRLQLAFHGRVTRLPAATRTVLLVAAASGAVDLAPVLRAAATLGADLGDLQPAQDADMVDTDGRTLTWRHPLLRSAVYRGAALTDRLAAHRALATALDDPDTADLRAWHLAAAATGPDEHTATALEHTADRARRRHGLHGAVTAYDRAAALSVDPTARIRRLVLAAETATEAGLTDQAQRLAERAASLTEAEPTDQPSLRTERTELDTDEPWPPPDQDRQRDERTTSPTEARTTTRPSPQTERTEPDTDESWQPPDQDRQRDERTTSPTEARTTRPSPQAERTELDTDESQQPPDQDRQRDERTESPTEARTTRPSPQAESAELDRGGLRQSPGDSHAVAVGDRFVESAERSAAQWDSGSIVVGGSSRVVRRDGETAPLSTGADVALRLALVRAQAEFASGEPGSAHRRLMGVVGVADARGAARILAKAVHTAWYLGAAELEEVAAVAATLRLDEGDPVTPILRYLTGAVAGRRGVDLREAVAAARAGGVENPAELVQLCGSGLVVGQDEQVGEVAGELIGQCREQGRIAVLAPLLFFRSEALLFGGRPRESRIAAEEGLRIARDIGQAQWVSQIHAFLAYLAALHGDSASCDAHAEQAVAEEFGGAGASWAQAARAMLALGEGRLAQARAELAHMTVEPARHQVIGLRTLADQIEVAVRLGATAQATEALDRLTEWSRRAGQDWIAALAARGRALVSEDSEPHFVAALTANRPFDEARTRLLYGEWLRRDKRKTDARTQLEQAMRLFDRLDAAPWSERARTELGALGVGTGARATGGPVDLLTPQEAQIVRLAAQGLSNREIAARLFLSHRTVGHHLYKAYPKLGVVSRAELGALELAE
ncbi:helix-turn-helix transcriptional regulator [Nocardia lasii]|uniref:AAA family ATPase n=1 Tax=Nocardia lasii TaxID=1616107 RepID=A0ABW1JR46_9NOCA